MVKRNNSFSRVLYWPPWKLVLCTGMDQLEEWVIIINSHLYLTQHNSSYMNRRCRIYCVCFDWVHWIGVSKLVEEMIWNEFNSRELHEINSTQIFDSQASLMMCALMWTWCAWWDWLIRRAYTTCAIIQAWWVKMRWMMRVHWIIDEKWWITTNHEPANN